ncbi:MAG: Gfo/Idh/MocA family oxidoreductase [Clostridiales bacterium]|nr:Gfo/Idh/MocA family oxidoreductase [Clostridiales bacterium]
MHQIGIIGYGGMGRAHARDLLHPASIRFAAAYDIDPVRMELAKQDGLVACASREELLSMPEIDTILVAVPNNGHLDNVLAAIEAGKNVICEKPVALNGDELAQMQAAAQKKGVKMTVHQNRRWDKDYLIVKNILESRVLGKPFRIESRVQGARGIADTWRRRKAYGGGMLYDWGVHLIDQLLQLTDAKIISVFAEFQYLSQNEVDDNIRLTLNFDDGLSTLMEIGTCNFLMLPRWYVCGKEGTALIPYWDCKGEIIISNGKKITWEDEIQTASLMGPSKTLQPRGENTITHLPLPDVTPDKETYYRMLNDALDGKGELPVTPAQAARVMKVIDLAFKSGAENKVIHIPEGF